MKSSIRGSFLLSLAWLWISVGSAEPLQTPIPAPPAVAAQSYLLMDYHSGTLLAEHQADKRLPPASLTKIMTADVVFREIAAGHLSLEDQVLVSEKAWRTGGSKMFIEVGTRVSVEDLLKGMIIQSGNDASVALAEYVAGSEETFAGLMNAQAQRLGMKNSHFVNATGLPHEDHYTTARDLALVTAATIREFPEYYAWYSQKSFTYNGIKQSNRNRLLWRDSSVDGVKTGHTKAAGYCLVASAKRGNMRLISVVLGTNSEEARAQASLALLNYGFRFFESHRLYPKDKAVARLRVWMGEKAELPVGPAKDVYVTIPRHSYDQLSAHIEKQGKLRAPIEKGQQVGELVLSLNDKVLSRMPVIALESVAEGSWWQKAKDSLLQWF